MDFQSRPFRELTQTDLQSLIDARIEEGRDFEYKQELPGDAASARKEYLADVTSFANSAGGYLFFGIAEDGGVPTQLCGVDAANVDRDILRLEQILRSSVQPRVVGVMTRPISLDGGRAVIVMRIPRSWSGPHQISQDEDFRFYGRSSRGKHRLDVTDLRNAFGVTSAATEGVRRFRADRVNQILAGETPVPMRGGAKIIFHLVPLNAFSLEPKLIPIEWLEQRERVLTPAEGAGIRSHINLDGVVIYTGYGTPESPAGVYAQIYRTGVVEWVNEEWLEPRPEGQLLIPREVGRYLGKVVGNYLKALGGAGVEPPVIFLLTLGSISAHSFALSGGAWMRNRFDRDIVLIPEVAIGDLAVDGAEAIAPAIAAAWNAAGFAKPIG